MAWKIIRNDIAQVEADAIVNAANSALQAGGGVCGAIFAAAGQRELQLACDALAPCPTGHSVITPAFRLRARYIIHTVGPRWQGGSQGEAALLRQAYLSALTLSEQYRCKSIAFPLISYGIYGYPKEEAVEITLDAFRSYLREHDMDITLVLYDRASLLCGERRYQELRSYIDERYVETHRLPRRRQERWFSAPSPVSYSDSMLSSAKEEGAGASAPLPMAAQAPAPHAAEGEKATSGWSKKKLQEMIRRADEPFSAFLFRLIEQKHLTDTQVYKGANMDRKLFSKLRQPTYHPNKYTVTALAVSMKLDLEETEELLRRAGYSLNPSSVFDIIVEYFIREGVYDIFEINAALFDYDQHLLGV